MVLDVENHAQNSNFMSNEYLQIYGFMWCLSNLLGFLSALLNGSHA